MKKNEKNYDNEKNQKLLGVMGTSGQKSAMVTSRPRKLNRMRPKYFNREYPQNLVQTPNFLALVLIQPVCCDNLFSETPNFI